MSLEILVSVAGVILSFIAIIVVANNTNRQIKNHNKESHRPYMDVVVTEDKLQEDSDTRLLDISNISKKQEDIEKIKYKNIGYGIATNVYIMPIRNDMDYRKNLYSLKPSIMNGLHFIVRYGITFNKYELGNNKSSYLLVLYCDIYQNVYSTLVSFYHDGKYLKVYHYWNENNSRFHIILSMFGCNYKKIKKQYLSVVFTRKRN